MHINSILDWFKKVRPEPNQKDFTTQLGVHIEEFGEMLDALSGETEADYRQLILLQEFVNSFARKLKAGDITVKVAEEDRVDFLDSLCDQIVTATGTAHTQRMDIDHALMEVIRSNDSKFDGQGLPIFDSNKKVIKGPDYWKPNLAPFV